MFRQPNKPNIPDAKKLEMMINERAEKLRVEALEEQARYTNNTAGCITSEMGFVFRKAKLPYNEKYANVFLDFLTTYQQYKIEFKDVDSEMLKKTFIAYAFSLLTQALQKSNSLNTVEQIKKIINKGRILSNSYIDSVENEILLENPLTAKMFKEQAAREIKEENRGKNSWKNKFKIKATAVAAVLMAGFGGFGVYSNRQQLGDFAQNQGQTVTQTVEMTQERVSKGFEEVSTFFDQVEPGPIVVGRDASAEEVAQFQADRQAQADKLEEEKRLETQNPVAQSLWGALDITTSLVNGFDTGTSREGFEKGSDVDQNQFKTSENQKSTQSLEHLENLQQPKKIVRDNIPLAVDFKGKLIFDKNRLDNIIKKRFELKNPLVEFPSAEESQEVDILLRIFAELYSGKDGFGSREMTELLKEWKILVMDDANGLFTIDMTELKNSIDSTINTSLDPALTEQFNEIKNPEPENSKLSKDLPLLGQYDILNPTNPKPKSQGLGQYDILN